jgi:HemY protein
VLLWWAPAWLLFGGAGVHSLLTLPERASEWRALRRERAAQAALREALSEYFGARYSRAHKAAQRALASSAIRRAAGRWRVRRAGPPAGRRQPAPPAGPPRRDETLHAGAASRGARAEHGVDDAARLLAAEWALEDRDAPRALEMLDQLPPGVARRTQALRLKLQASRMARQPLEALHTARLLAKHQAFSPLVARGLLRSLAGETLDAPHDVQQLRRLWGQFDAADQRDPRWPRAPALRAVQLQAADDARQWLRPFWDRLSELA